MSNMTNLMGTWLAKIEWKKLFFIISFILFSLGTISIFKGRSLKNKRDILSHEISTLNTEIDLLKNTSIILVKIKRDFDRLKDINLDVKPFPLWLTPDYLRKEYFLIFPKRPFEPAILDPPLDTSKVIESYIKIIRSRITTSKSEEICTKIQETTEGIIDCRNLMEVPLFIQLIKNLKSSQYQFETDIEELAAQQVKSERIVKGKREERPSDDSIDRFNILGYIIIFFGVVSLLITGIVYVVDFINYSRKRLQQDVEDVEKAQKDLSLGQSPWKNASKVLDAYYKRNLGQTGKIYITSIIVMLAGFFVVLGSIVTGIIISTSEQPNQKSQERFTKIVETNNLEKLTKEQLEILLNPPGNAALIISLIGTASGIITSFIGATFLYLYQLTLRQSSEYTASLARTNTVGIAMEILSTINTTKSIEKEIKPKSTEKKENKEIDQEVESAKIAIAKLLIKQLQNLNKDTKVNIEKKSSYKN